MKYIREERLVIGERIYCGELSRFEAAEEYGISEATARDYMRLYRTVNQLPQKCGQPRFHAMKRIVKAPRGMEDFQSMTKEELIHELLLARIAEARLKKGYEVKGDGAQKEYVPFDKESTK